MFDQETSISAAQALEYRLPANVTPDRYDLVLTPDLKAFTFDGAETIADESQIFDALVPGGDEQAARKPIARPEPGDRD